MSIQKIVSDEDYKLDSRVTVNNPLLPSSSTSDDGISSQYTKTPRSNQDEDISSRLSLYQLTSEKNQPSGYAGLNEDAELVGLITIRTETSGDLANIILETGELATATDDPGSLYIGDGSTLGGVSITPESEGLPITGGTMEGHINMGGFNIRGDADNGVSILESSGFGAAFIELEDKNITISVGSDIVFGTKGALKIKNASDDLITISPQSQGLGNISVSAASISISGDEIENSTLSIINCDVVIDGTLTFASPSTGWSVTNVTEDKTFNANSTTTEELADVLGTLINTLKTQGILE